MNVRQKETDIEDFKKYSVFVAEIAPENHYFEDKLRYGTRSRLKDDYLTVRDLFILYDFGH